MLKKILLSTILTLQLSLGWAAVGAGDKAPDFTGKDTNGKSYTLSKLKGNIVVLEWTNHECPYVKKHYDSGNMQGLQQRATADGVIWLSIVSSAKGKQGYTSNSQANTIIEKAGAKATARIIDAKGTIGKLYSAKTTPHMFVINQDGMIVYSGAIDSDTSTDPATISTATNYVEDALSALKNGETIQVAKTVSYGCGVKY